ncbi:MAG: lysophospholipid acyltransferase family protein [Isosphaeraceae bacterium]|nr:lysophospholipid acyltransferase family protein [Isosphaeraceae bacterium]
MEPSCLLMASAALLLASRLLMPRPGARPEIEGYRQFLWELNRLFCSLWHGLDSTSMAPLPERGPAILIANHTSGLDPSLLQATSRRVLGFLIAREFYEHRVFHPICRILGCIPVNRDGHDLAAVRAALLALKAGRVVPIFPEGRINPTSGRTILEPKPGVAFIVLRARVPVIPAFIWGTPATNRIVRALVTPSRAHVIYGPPIDPSALDVDGPVDRERLAAVADQLMDAIRSLQARALGGESVREPGAVATHDPDRLPRRTEERAGALSGDRAALRGA